jgi:hypothetical protein
MYGRHGGMQVGINCVEAVKDVRHVLKVLEVVNGV